VGDEEYECHKCRRKERAIGAEIPFNVLSPEEHLATHPELEVLLLSNEEAAAARNGFRPENYRLADATAPEGTGRLSKFFVSLSRWLR
jgi:hypothetical protein